MQLSFGIKHHWLDLYFIMIWKKFTTVFLLSFISVRLFCQCEPGQLPATAFPVCGTAIFHQDTVNACGGTQVFAPSCNNDGITLTDINPFWYSFTCFESGSLGFVITPANSNDDYDWQLFDITGRDPSVVYTNDASIFVACNWSGETGATGASDAGTSLSVCASNGSGTRPLFSSQPALIQGHQYILLVSHFTVSSQSGYDLSFGGGTASITDPTPPALAGARAICDGIKMTVKLNKKMKCSSLNADGSDFLLTPSVAPIIAAEGINCNTGFDMDSILLTLAGPLPPGNYTVSVRPSNLLDNCNNPIPPGSSLPVTVFPLFPTPMDSLTKIGCAPDLLQLVFNKPMICSSISADGSEFVVTEGATNIAVAGAEGVCNADGLTSVINVKLATAIQQAGNYRITLKTGTDGNTIFNECAKETAAGSFINFIAVDTVNADFTYRLNLGCTADTIHYSHNGFNGVTTWKWTFDGNITASAKDSSLVYSVFGNKTAVLTVSNGTCNATSVVTTVMLDNAVDAAFESTAVVCPGDPAVFKDKSINRIQAWQWDFGNGSNSNLQEPPAQLYPADNNNVIRDLPVRLIVTNDIGCSDTATNIIQVVGNCYIAVPNAFTPNGDGLNDFLYPTNAYKARDLYFAVYNRGGNKIFETRNWIRKWDGTLKGNPQDPGTYVWFLQYTHIDTGKRIELKGSTVLLR